MSSVLPPLSELAEQLRGMAVAVDASELHGALVGWLAGGGEDGVDWLAQVMADPALPAEMPGSALARLRAVTRKQLADCDFALELLIANDGADLAARSGSLFAWCRGFLAGFGLAAGEKPPLSAEGREALADLARFAAASAQRHGDEDDERALVEITEFVRVASLLLHGDCVLGPRHRWGFN